MKLLELPKRGDPITHEWARDLVEAINELRRGPAVVAPLANKDGAVYFGDNYLLRSVKTTGTISARSGETMGSGQANFYSARAAALSLCLGNASVKVYSKSGASIPSGVRGVVAWVDEQWELISADCSGVA